MSNQQHSLGKGIHPEDLNALTEYWHRKTNYINDKVDEAFKSAQDDAYARGYRRGREDLIEIRKQRDELAAKVAAWEQKAANWMASPEAAQRLDGYRDLAHRLNVAEQQRDKLLAALGSILPLLELPTAHGPLESSMRIRAARAIIAEIEAEK